MNNSISYSSLREKLKCTLDEVCSTSTPILVKRKNGEDVVIMSKREFESMEETAYLLSSPKNSYRLHQALNEDKKNRLSFNTVEELENEVRNRVKRSGRHNILD